MQILKITFIPIILHLAPKTTQKFPFPLHYISKKPIKSIYPLHFAIFVPINQSFYPLPSPPCLSPVFAYSVYLSANLSTTDTHNTTHSHKLPKLQTFNTLKQLQNSNNNNKYPTNILNTPQTTHYSQLLTVFV